MDCTCKYGGFGACGICMCKQAQEFLKKQETVNEAKAANQIQEEKVNKEYIVLVDGKIINHSFWTCSPEVEAQRLANLYPGKIVTLAEYKIKAYLPKSEVQITKF
jgi:hypothetical protein